LLDKVGRLLLDREDLLQKLTCPRISQAMKQYKRERARISALVPGYVAPE